MSRTAERRRASPIRTSKLVYLDQTGNPTTLPLAQQPDGSYLYSTTSFFPIDNLGWVSGSPAASIQTTNGHNFSFDSELRYQFTYNAATTPAPKLSFFGDDDVWVFINGKLAVDLGGLHSQTAGSVTLNTATAGTLGLTSAACTTSSSSRRSGTPAGSNYQFTLDGFEHDTRRASTKCGDGIVAGDEVCDDGMNDGSYGGCMPGCKARGPYCGDNKVAEPARSL